MKENGGNIMEENDTIIQWKKMEENDTIIQWKKMEENDIMEEDYIIKSLYHCIIEPLNNSYF